MKFPILVVLIVIAPIWGCIQTETGEGGESRDRVPEQTPTQIKNNQVISLLGNVLPEKALTEYTKKKRQEALQTAQNRYEENPNSEENIIWYGRRLAYLGLFEDAIRIYSVGLDQFPDSYRLLRHRGHRYITIRKFDEAIEDLQRAAFYSRPAKNETEPDGLPNRLKKPLSNDKFNIWYHLGIAYYLKGNYDKAISSFKQCMEFSNNDDLLVATTDWFYMTYRKIGNQTAAEELLGSISVRMTIIENYAYHQRLMLYKGIYDSEELIDEAEREENSLDPTLGYGIAHWHLIKGSVLEAKILYERIISNPNWDAFGYIAAEVDLLALQNY